MLSIEDVSRLQASTRCRNGFVIDGHRTLFDAKAVFRDPFQLAIGDRDVNGVDSARNELCSSPKPARSALRTRPYEVQYAWFSEDYGHCGSPKARDVDEKR